MADPISDDSDVPLTFVACVSDEEILAANLLASACLKPGSPHEVILIKNGRSAADGLNIGIARARHELVVCLHQDVRLPPGWDHRLIKQLDAATRQWGPIGVAGVYGVGEPTQVPAKPPAPADELRAQAKPQPAKFAVRRMGRVIHRGHPLFDSPNLPAKVDFGRTPARRSKEHTSSIQRGPWVSLPGRTPPARSRGTLLITSARSVTSSTTLARLSTTSTSARLELCSAKRARRAATG